MHGVNDVSSAAVCPSIRPPSRRRARARVRRPRPALGASNAARRRSGRHIRVEIWARAIWSMRVRPTRGVRDLSSRAGRLIVAARIRAGRARTRSARTHKWVPKWAGVDLKKLFSFFRSDLFTVGVLSRLVCAPERARRGRARQVRAHDIGIELAQPARVNAATVERKFVELGATHRCNQWCEWFPLIFTLLHLFSCRFSTGSAADEGAVRPRRWALQRHQDSSGTSLISSHNLPRRDFFVGMRFCCSLFQRAWLRLIASILSPLA